MKKNLFYQIVVAFSVIIILVYCFQQYRQYTTNNTSSTILNSNSTQSKDSENEIPLPADKITIIHFHATQQCVSCIAVGNLALKTLETNFAAELNSGKITYQDVNVELPENQTLVDQYQARGAALFLNVINENKDHIMEDVTVWRLINDEEQFITYFTNKLNKFLGK